MRKALFCYRCDWENKPGAMKCERYGCGSIAFYVGARPPRLGALAHVARAMAEAAVDVAPGVPARGRVGRRGRGPDS